MQDSPSLALGIKTFELHVQTFFGRFARINSAAFFRGSRAQCLPPCALLFNPKKAGPDQLLPVMASATFDRLLYRQPAYS